jgi:uncharacterized ferritin-like protein (DUF455 family)
MRAAALQALLASDPYRKVAQTGAIKIDEPVDVHATLVVDAGQVIPGRPQEPRLVPPQQVPLRKIGSPDGHAALIHAIAHIEFNAINLALDVIWRWSGLPAAFYSDWLVVAQEEAVHFALLSDHLATLGYAYGDFPAHDGLWQMAERTANDLLARMALVPRTLEARGLDASPAVRAKLAGIGDMNGAAIIDRILADEVGHVATGNHWYRWLCDLEQRDPITTYDELVTRYHAPRPAPPFNLEARQRAGFTPEELARLSASVIP